MKLLAVDTTQRACSVAVLDGDTVLSQLQDDTPNKQSERLLAMIDACMQQSCLSVKQLTHLVATIGPGSFTGLRIGIAALQGMALALPQAKAVGVTTLEVLAADAREDALRNKSGTTIAVINAMRSQLYVQAFSTESQQPCDEAVLLHVEDFKNYCANYSGAYIASNCAELLRTEKKYAIHAVQAGIIAAHKTTHVPMQPVYIRPPDAKKPAKMQ